MNEDSGNARYSLFHCASQPPSRDNRLHVFKEATQACEPQYSKVVSTSSRQMEPLSEPFHMASRNRTLFPAAEAMTLALRGAHGTSAGDRNASRAPTSTHAHAGYAPATTCADAVVSVNADASKRPSRAGSPGAHSIASASRHRQAMSESSILSESRLDEMHSRTSAWRPTSGASTASNAFYGRPCSSKAMRDLWKMSFAPTDAAVHPSSEFAAAPSTVQRNTFLFQEYTKRGQLLMRPSSGDSRPDSAYRPVTYMEERTQPASLTLMRPFGDLGSYNVMMAPRPSSSTFQPGGHGGQGTPPLANGNTERPTSRRECRCSSRQSTPSSASTRPIQ